MASLRKLLKDCPPQKILAIRTDRIGDLIVSTPILKAMRVNFPSSEITVLVSSYCVDILKGTGLVDKVITELPARLNYDFAVALAPRSESIKLAWRSRAPIRLGYTYADRPLVRVLARLALTHEEVISIPKDSASPHEVVQLDRLARRMGLPSTAGSKLVVGAVRQSKVDGRIVFHLGDRWLTKGWSARDLRLLIDGLQAMGEVVVSAGPREKDWLSRQGNCFSDLDLRLDLPFLEWAGLISSASCLVSPDTGAVHIAAALEVPVVVAYEAASFKLCSSQWTPWMVKSFSVVKSSPEETIPCLMQAVEELVLNSRNGAS